jgi:hypothetical protein
MAIDQAHEVVDSPQVKRSTLLLAVTEKRIMLETNPRTPDQTLFTILARALDLELRLGRKLSIPVQSDSESTALSPLLSQRLKTSVIRPLRIECKYRVRRSSDRLDASFREKRF